jgi:hypothetical protein
MIRAIPGPVEYLLTGAHELLGEGGMGEVYRAVDTFRPIDRGA